MKISAVIPGYNYARFLAEAIESALAQTQPVHEIIVVDDGSTDDTPAVARQYEGKVRYVRTENRGVSNARNTGAALATGEAVAFLDADDRWLPRKIELQTAAFAAHPDAGLIHAGSRVFDDEAQQHLCEFSVQPELDVHALIRCCSISASSVVVRRSVLEKVGSFDPQLVGTEDWDMWLRIALEHRIVGMPEVLVEYRSHGRSLSGHATRQFQNSMAVLDKAQRLHPGCGECRAALRFARTQMRREYFRKLTAQARAAFREQRAVEGWKLRVAAVLHHPGFLWELPQLVRERAAARQARAQALGL
jgi:glycosyltransferase involved in cell wall biosynthesis